MLTDTQEAQLKDVTAEALGVDPADIDADTAPATLPEWTSFSHLTLMSSVEEAFGITFSMEEMTGVHNFGDLQRVVAAQLS